MNGPKGSRTMGHASSKHEAIVDVECVTPGWLTGVLRRRGVLPGGGVKVVERSAPRVAFGAAVYSLAVTYSPEAPPSAPTRLILKLARGDVRVGEDQPSAARQHRYGTREVEFYVRIAPRMAGFPAPRFFDAADSDDGTRWHVLMEDVSATHEQPPYPVPPTERHCALAIETLARLHAAWWRHPELGAGLGEVPDGAAIQEPAPRTERTVSTFVEFLGDRLSPGRRRVYELLLDSQHRLRRLQWARPLTLAHGDAHWWNLLYPRPAAGGSESAAALLIDWQMWDIAPGTSDLAHAIGNAWFPERRQRLERPLLRRYHRALSEHGVRDYGWDECWNDYRLFVATTPFTPAFQWQRGGTPLVWWPNLERAMLAFEDLGCEELARA